jgi:hypothetical protein
MLRDSSTRLRKFLIVIRKYQQAFLTSLPGNATDIKFIGLNLLLRFTLVILVSFSFFSIPSLPYTIAEKSIRDFCAPLAANVATGPNVINGDANFELKPALIMMFQASPF